MNVFSRSTALAGIAVVSLTVAGCGGGDTMSGMSMSTTSSPTAGTSASSSPTQSGSMAESMPGMPGTAGSSSAVADPTPGGEVSAEHNAADVTFAQMMIEHHRGAIEMARLAPDRAADPEVRELAAAIEAAQAPEIELMTGWLASWGAPVTAATTGGHAGHMDTEAPPQEAAGMPGMMTADQMAALTASTGAEFDRSFLEMMVMHHQGAVQMAETEIAEGVNPEALALAESVRTSQTGEIAEMQEMLDAM